MRLHVNETALSVEWEEPIMLKPIEKPARQPLIHHPSDVLDCFCRYDAANLQWLDFDESVSQQIAELEARNQRYIRPIAAQSQRISSANPLL